MLPVVVAASEREAILGPDNHGAVLESAGLQGFEHRVRVHAGVPDVGDVTWEQRPRFAPVGAVIVEHLAGLERVVAGARWIVIHAIRRVGDHQVRLHFTE